MSVDVTSLVKSLSQQTKSIVVDASHFPIVYIAYPSPFSRGEWDRFVGSFDVLLDLKAPFGWINDARTAYLPAARDRSALAAHHKTRAADYRRYALGAATVSSSPLVRGVITAIEWIHPAPFPHVSVDSTRDAELFVRRKLGVPTEPLLFTHRTPKTVAAQHIAR